MIKTVFFDGDNTLWDFHEVMNRAYRAVRDELQIRFTSEYVPTVSQMISIRKRVVSSLEGVTTDLEKIRLEAFRETVRAYFGCQDDQLAEYLNGLYLNRRFEDIELFSDVIPVLDGFRESYAVGLISNGNGYPERCGLENRLDFVVFSQDCGFRKPGKRIFEIACDRSRCDPHEAVHVGDSLENDVAGANAAGMRSVWLNRSGSKNKSGIIPDYEVSSLCELPRIVTVLNGDGSKNYEKDSNHIRR